MSTSNDEKVQMYQEEIERAWERVRGYLKDTAAHLRQVADRIDEKAQVGCFENIRQAQHELTWGTANVSSHIDSAMSTVKDIALLTSKLEAARIEVAVEYARNEK